MTNTATPRIDWDTVKNRILTAQGLLERSSTVDESRMQEIFHERAMRLAESAGHIDSASNTVPVFIFRIEGETYGIELKHVARVFSDAVVTPVPGSPTAVLGVVNLQGEVRTVVDLRRLLSLPEGDCASNRYIMLLRHDNRQVGLQVEQIDDVRRIARGDLATSAADPTDRITRYVRGVTLDKVILLNVQALFDSEFAADSVARQS